MYQFFAFQTFVGKWVFVSPFSVFSAVYCYYQKNIFESLKRLHCLPLLWQHVLFRDSTIAQVGGARRNRVFQVTQKRADIYALAICYVMRDENSLVPLLIVNMIFTRSGYCIHATCGDGDGDDTFSTAFFLESLSILIRWRFISIFHFFHFFLRLIFFLNEQTNQSCLFVNFFDFLSLFLNLSICPSFLLTWINTSFNFRLNKSFISHRHSPEKCKFLKKKWYFDAFFDCVNN